MCALGSCSLPCYRVSSWSVADGARLHEEVLLAARAVPSAGRSRRLEVEERRFELLRQAVEAALDPDACQPADPDASRRLAELWPDLRSQLAGDAAARAAVRQVALERDLDRRKAEDLDRVDVIAEHMRRSLSDALVSSPGSSSAALISSTSPNVASSRSTGTRGGPGSTASMKSGNVSGPRSSAVTLE